MKRKSAQIYLCIFSVCFCVYSIYGFVDLVHQSHARAIGRDFGRASEELQKSPPGMERVEVFVKRLKEINPGYAPAEVKQALSDYISATEQGLDAIKAGRDSHQYDAAMADARERLIAGVKKHH